MLSAPACRLRRLWTTGYRGSRRSYDTFCVNLRLRSGG
jgi:hypothetical protein